MIIKKALNLTLIIVIIVFSMSEDKTITIPDNTPLTESEKQLATEHDRKLFTRNIIYNDMVPKISLEELEFYKLQRKVKRLEKKMQIEARLLLSKKEEELMTNYKKAKEQHLSLDHCLLRQQRKSAEEKCSEVIKNLNLLPTKEECKAGHKIQWLRERPKRRKIGNEWVIVESENDNNVEL